MAAAVDNLESLSNADLREQCKLFGLPNVPVTDTSRKILIRKLKLAMEGPANGEKDKTKRRETIHVVNVTKPAVKDPEPEPVRKLDTSRSAGRRTTIAATNTSFSTSSSVDPEPVGKVDRRRSSRYSSTSSETAKKPIEVAKRKTAILEEDSDEDDLILIEATKTAEKVHKETTPSRTKAAPSQESRERRSRSASLQKSPTVTTSYQKDVPSTVHETDESGTDNEVLTQKQNVYKYDAAKPFVPTNIERQSYYKPAAPLNVSSSRYSTLGTTSTIRNSNLTTASTVTSGLGTSNLSRRYTTGVTHKYEEDDNDEDPAVEIGGGNTPYYSDFTRRLERLKNEQLNLSGKKEREYSSQRDVIVPTSRAYPRRQTSNAPNDGVSGFFDNLDRKYQIKNKLLIILAVFVLLTVYIFIFH